MPSRVIARLEEEQRQIVLLALAKLAVERPGWLAAIEEIALQMDNKVDGKPEMFDRFRAIYGGE